jgi:hypothetical protein
MSPENDAFCQITILSFLQKTIYLSDLFWINRVLHRLTLKRTSPHSYLTREACGILYRSVARKLRILPN